MRPTPTVSAAYRRAETAQKFFNEIMREAVELDRCLIYTPNPACRIPPSRSRVDILYSLAQLYALALYSPNLTERPSTAPNPARSGFVAQPPFQLSNSTGASVSISISSPIRFHAEHPPHLEKHDELRNNLNRPFLKNPRGQKDDQQTEDRTTFY
jgi:hypothetical protein